MNVELLRDAERDDGWWLMVGGSEQSYVDTADPLHLEFEYVQMLAQLLEARWSPEEPVTALHLGGGLCTVPRWLAARQASSRQRVVEHSTQIARLAISLELPAAVVLEVQDAVEALALAAESSVDLLVCDLYEGPDTVTSLFSLDQLRIARGVLRPDGLYVCNLSDATPFALGRVVAATLREVFGSVVVLAEPAVLRGRRSGNLVLAAGDRPFDVSKLARRAAGGALRFRLLADADLGAFIDTASAAAVVADLPPSGESTGRRLL